MLKVSTFINSASVYNLVKLWAARYVPDLSTLSSQADGLNVYSLVEATSLEGRTQTIAKLKHLLNIDCEFAGIETNTLFSYVPNIVNLAEARRLAHFVWQVYQTTLEIYLQHAPSPATLEVAKHRFAQTTNLQSEVLKMPGLEMPAIEQLATALEPVLLELQQQHLLAKDKRAIGFVNTQFHFSTKIVLKQLTLPEQILVSPYFKFVEEQVLIPWQRVCCAAAMHQLDSPEFVLVQQLIPFSDQVAINVYHRALELNPTHCSRRGNLTEPGVAASTIRDMNMFQAYLWLCVLEGSMAVVEQELLPLCVMVLPSVEVTWELTSQMLQALEEELMMRVSPAQKLLLQPYTQALKQVFSNL